MYSMAILHERSAKKQNVDTAVVAIMIGVANFDERFLVDIHYIYLSRDCYR